MKSTWVIPLSLVFSLPYFLCFLYLTLGVRVFRLEREEGISQLRLLENVVVSSLLYLYHE